MSACVPSAAVLPASTSNRGSLVESRAQMPGSWQRAIAVLLAMCLVACVDAGEPGSQNGQRIESGEPATASSADAFYIEEATLRELKKKAESGDAAAAKRVADHYAFVENDLEQSTRWLEITANSGDPMAMQNVAVSLEALGGEANCRKALQWFERAQQEAPPEIVEEFGIARSASNLRQGMAECIARSQ